MPTRQESINLLNFFILAFLRPTEEWLVEVGESWEKVKNHFPLTEIKLVDSSNMNQEYTRLFRFGKEVPCPPYESVYRMEDRTLMSHYAIDVENRMRSFGVEVSKNFKEPPEHISVELEFLKYLYLIGEGEALEEAESFLEDHLIQWVPQFCNCIIKNSKISFYKEVCVLLKEFLNDELRDLKAI